MCIDIGILLFKFFDQSDPSGFKKYFFLPPTFENFEWLYITAKVVLLLLKKVLSLLSCYLTTLFNEDKVIDYSLHNILFLFTNVSK